MWREIRAHFTTQIEGLPDPEFTKTYFSSITRRLHGTVGVAPEIEFVAADLDPLASVASEVVTDITWHGDRAAHFVNNMMSQGAVMIDPTGVVRMRAKE